MKKSLLFLSGLVVGAMPLLLADDHRESEKERDEPRVQERERAERIKKEELRIYEAAREGKITREEGRQELEKIDQRERANLSEAQVRREKEVIEKAHQIRRKQKVEHEKERFWKRVEEEIEGAVRSGRMSRKQADAEYERIKGTQKQKEELSRELHRDIEQGLRELQIAVREGKIGQEDARREGDQMRRNLEREIHAAYRRIDFEAQKSRIHQLIGEGSLSEEDGERRLAEMQRRMESEERRMHDGERGMRRHHEEREHREERRYWEDEEELWEQVAQGLKAAVRLGRMSEREAREIWEGWRNHEEGDDHELDHDHHGEE